MLLIQTICLYVDACAEMIRSYEVDDIKFFAFAVGRHISSTEFALITAKFTDSASSSLNIIY